MGDVALEIPLPLLALGRLFEGDHLGAPRVEVLGEPLDGPALARRVPTFEEDDDPLAGVLDPVLQLQQFDLQQPLDHLVLGPGHALGVGVALPPGVDQAAVLPPQDRLVVVVGLVELELVEVLRQVDVEVEDRGIVAVARHGSGG